MIREYLDSLSAELRVPRRVRARIVAEAQDHLEEAVAAGQTEREAVESFGDPREVAARFHEELASASARRASLRTTVLSALLVIGLAAATLGPANDFPFGVVIFLGAQLGVVAGGLALARWWRYRNGVPASRLVDVWRTNALAVACVGVVSLAELLDAAIGGADSHAALAIGSAMALAATVTVGISVARSVERARVVQAEASGDDAVDDLVALVPIAAPVLRRAQSELRGRPWLFCVLFAGVCGLVLAAQHNVTEGGVAIAWRPLLAAFVIAAIEATAVIACFAAFGRFLGIRR